MKIALAQVKSKAGNFESNIRKHAHAIKLASQHGAGLIVFPELSLTSYEPTMAGELALNPNDVRLAKLLDESERQDIAILAGAPLSTRSGVTIALLQLQNGEIVHVFYKEFLHLDEKPFFVSGTNSFHTIELSQRIGLGICYELSVPEHITRVMAENPSLYLASVAKTQAAISGTRETLSQTAAKYSIPVMMCNAVGTADGTMCAGQSAVWDSRGLLIDQLDGSSEAILLFDSGTEKVLKLKIQ